MQPNPVTISVDGIFAERRVYPETGSELVEYREGNCLVMLGRPGVSGRRDLNVRLAEDRSVCMLDGGEISDAEAERLMNSGRVWWKRAIVGTFDELQACYLHGCARHGFEPRSEASNRAFFEQTRGYGVLWGARKY